MKFFELAIFELIGHFNGPSRAVPRQVSTLESLNPHLPLLLLSYRSNHDRRWNKFLLIISKTVESRTIKFGTPRDTSEVDFTNFFQIFRSNRSAVPWIPIYRLITTYFPQALPVPYIWSECSPYLMLHVPPVAFTPSPPPAPPSPSKYLIMQLPL